MTERIDEQSHLSPPETGKSEDMKEVSAPPESDHDCCSSSPTQPSESPSPAPARQEKKSSKAICPSCGHTSQAVKARTVRQLITNPGGVNLVANQYFFCAQPGCELVYFALQSDQSFSKSDLTVRVGAKETEDPIPVCYCFGHSRGSIRDEIERNGHSEVVEEIRGEIAASNCACDVKNPSGKCCLGEVTKAVREIEATIARRCGSTANTAEGSSTCEC